MASTGQHHAGRPRIDRPSAARPPGLTTKMDGLNDAYLIEAAVCQYKVTDPKALGSFVKVSDLIDKEGALGTYKKFKSIAGA